MKKLKTVSLKFGIVLGLGIIIRLLLMPITGHSDIWALNFGRYFFVQRGVFNIYDYLYNLPPTHQLVQNYGTNFFTYPPLAYFVLGIFGFLFKPFYQHTFTLWLMNNFSEVYQNSEVFKTLFLLKLPYLFFDLGTAFLLMKLFDTQKQKKLALILWLFNPLSLYSSFMVGQFDIIPVFFVILSLYFMKLRKPSLAAISLGVGGSLKMFPLLFLPFLIFSSAKDFRERLRLGIIGLLPYVLTIIPFLGSAVFRSIVLFSPQSQKMLFAAIPVSGAEGISIFIFLFSIFCIHIAHFGKPKDLWKYYLGVMLLFFSITHYHPQWFLWITPFLLIELIKNNFKHLWLQLGLLGSWLLITLLFEPSLNIGLFSPVFPSLQEVVPFSEVINKFYNPFQIKTFIRSAFAGISLGMTWLNFK